MSPVKLLSGLLAKVAGNQSSHRNDQTVTTENIDTSKETLMLYHSDLCGFCWRVRSVIDELGVEVEYRDIGDNREWATELVAARGRGTVPVLRRIQSGDLENSEWMPESSDIIRYLKQAYAS